MHYLVDGSAINSGGYLTSTPFGVPFEPAGSSIAAEQAE